MTNRYKFKEWDFDQDFDTFMTTLSGTLPALVGPNDNLKIFAEKMKDLPRLVVVIQNNGEEVSLDTLLKKDPDFLENEMKRVKNGGG